MNRRKFIATGCISCVTGGLFLYLMESCATAKSSQATIVGDNMVVPVSDFILKKGAENSFRKYLVLHNEILLHPICVYRFGENNYEALLMKCTHQGAELQVFGDKLQCPAHGSEFDHHGKAQGGPADKALRTFPVVIEDNQLKISLK